MFRKSDTQSSVTAAVHQRAFGRRMTSKYLKLQIHLAVGWQLWRKEGSLGRNRAGMIQGQLAERAEQAIIQKSETRLVRVVITALENRLVLLWQSSQGYWWAGGSSSQKPILPSLTVGATGLTPAPALSQLPFPPPPLTSPGSSSLTPRSSPAPPAPRSSKTDLPHSSEKPWAGSGCSAKETTRLRQEEYSTLGMPVCSLDKLRWNS